MLTNINEQAQNSMSDAVLVKYRTISSNVRFGETSLGHVEHLVNLENKGQFSKTTHAWGQYGSGWLALEIAAAMPESSIKDKFLAKSEQRFRSAIEIGYGSDSIDDRDIAYKSELGMIALYARRDPIEAIVDDNPGMYTSVIEKIINDNKYQRTSEGIGLLSEVLVAGIASHVGKLCLPASVRHDMSVNHYCKNPNYDLELWHHTVPDSTSMPTRFLQVKTRRRNGVSEYSSKISVVHATDLGNLNQLSRALIDHYEPCSSSAQDKMLLDAGNNLINMVSPMVSTGFDETRRAVSLQGSGSARGKFIKLN